MTAPVLQTASAVLRPLRPSDSAPLVQALAVEEVARFIRTPPPTVHAFNRFTAWAAREHRAGRQVVLAVVPHGRRQPAGLFQVVRHGPSWDIAEWGFVLGADTWGSGLFMHTAPLVVDYAIGTLGVRRLEARAAVCNGRGNGALAKVGAVCEAVLSQSGQRDDGPLDERLWTIVASRWPRSSRLPLALRLQMSPRGAK